MLPRAVRPANSGTLLWAKRYAPQGFGLFALAFRMLSLRQNWGGVLNFVTARGLADKIGMLSMNDLKPGVLIDLAGEPYQVLESNFNKVAQRRPVMQTKIRHVITGKVRAETFQQSDRIQEANIERTKTKFTYRTRDEFFFQADSGKKFNFKENMLEDKIGYLKKDMPVDIFVFKEKPISIELPIKVVLEIKDAPPATRGDTVQGALKDAVLETGAKIKVPLFIEAGEKIEVDTRTGTYVRRVQ